MQADQFAEIFSGLSGLSLGNGGADFGVFDVDRLGLGFFLENGLSVRNDPDGEGPENASVTLDGDDGSVTVENDEGGLTVREDGTVNINEQASFSPEGELNVPDQSLQLSELDAGSAPAGQFLQTGPGGTVVAGDPPTGGGTSGIGFTRAENGDLVIENPDGEFIMEGKSFHAGSDEAGIDVSADGHVQLFTTDAAGNIVGVAAGREAAFVGTVRADGTFVGSITRADGSTTTGVHDADDNLTGGIEIDGAGIPLVDKLSIGADRTTSADVFQDPLTGDLTFENGDNEFVFNGNSFHVNIPNALDMLLNGKPVAVKDDITWGNLQGIPAGFADGVDNPGGELADNSVSSNHIADGQVMNADVASGAISGDKLAADIAAWNRNPETGDLLVGTPTAMFQASAGSSAPAFVFTQSGNPAAVNVRKEDTGANAAMIVARFNSTGNALLAVNSGGGNAIETSGPVKVGGALDVTGTKNFRIPHPLDAKKELFHAAVEAPKPLNVYSGNVRTNRRGFAVVRLPRYFDAINRDFRYQLTIVGRSFARAIVWKEIEGNRFTIRTDAPGVKVSWQVTAERDDAYMRANPFRTERPKQP